MTDQNQGHETWEEVINDFFRVKKEAEEDKYLKETIKKITDIYKDKNYFNDENIELFFENKKKATQTSLEFQRNKLTHILGFTEIPSELNQIELNEDYQKKLKYILYKYEPVEWITIASENALKVSFATHVIKLTHSKIDSPSLYDQIDSVKPDVLTTSSLLEKNIDGAVSGNQYAPIFQFLELELNGDKLASEFTVNLPSALKPFAANNEVLDA